ncbi:uncharacterized protein LOC111302310 [Durio zibethinus]|uniref:Uncharacterized protein LOC111302310 n=1 Tax=Durio zibethinus TaxID=66656 RepID=A0A6P5ZNM2_DURZI|nr:uncharacterized protein LOC111302310 [Durio zibethinus]
MEMPILCFRNQRMRKMGWVGSGRSCSPSSFLPLRLLSFALPLSPPRSLSVSLNLVALKKCHRLCIIVVFVGFLFIVLMATAPIKSQPLHNFNFSFLKWGTHGGGSSSTTTDHRSSPESDSDHGRLRPTRVGSRSTRIHRLFFPSPPKPFKQRHREEEGEQEEEDPLRPRKYEAEEEEDETVQRPWNLRPRKVVVETTAVVTSVVEKFTETAAPKSMRLRGLAETGGVGEKKEKNKFWIALSREEIEEDIFVMTGSRPARRPQKRSKNIQKQLDNVFPGLWLVGTTADAYRVADAPVKK